MTVTGQTVRSAGPAGSSSYTGDCHARVRKRSHYAREHTVSTIVASAKLSEGHGPTANISILLMRIQIG